MDPRQLNGHPREKDDPCPEFVENFMLRVQDLIDQYNPDFLYLDDNCDRSFDAGAPAERKLKVWLGMPELTPPIMAYFYDQNLRRNQGRLGAVSNIKTVPPAVVSTLVSDFEMSQAGSVQPDPWQTDACIGGWHCSRSIYEHHRYRTAQSMRHLLLDVVSKNGNLLLNIPLPGTAGPTIRSLPSGAVWRVNEAEQRSNLCHRAGQFWRGPNRAGRADSVRRGPTYVPGDIRFTSKGGDLYAIALAWPKAGRLVIRSLASDPSQYPGEITSIGLLGSAGAAYVVASSGRSDGNAAGKASVRSRVDVLDQCEESIRGAGPQGRYSGVG